MSYLNANFHSEVSIDKLVRFYSGTFDASSDVITRNYTLAGSPNAVEFYQITHNLGRPLACLMQWSLDGVDWYDGGIFNSSNQSSLAYSDGNNIYIFSPVGSGTVHYRVWGLWIDDYDGSNPAIDFISYSNMPIQFDSRENYQKILEAGSVSFDAGTFSSSQTRTVNHGLGYTPNARVWQECFAGEVWQGIAGGASNPFVIDDAQDTLSFDITNTDLFITSFRNSNAIRKCWYRIYYDAN